MIVEFSYGDFGRGKRCVVATTRLARGGAPLHPLLPRGGNVGALCPDPPEEDSLPPPRLHKPMSDAQHPIGEAAPAAQAPAVIHLPPPADPVPAAKAVRRRSGRGGLPGRRGGRPRPAVLPYPAPPGGRRAAP